jgi:hypothetical protein
MLCWAVVGLLLAKSCCRFSCNGFIVQSKQVLNGRVNYPRIMSVVGVPVLNEHPRKGRISLAGWYFL